MCVMCRVSQPHLLSFFSCVFFVDSGVLVKVVKDTVLTFRNINVMVFKMTLNSNFYIQTGIRGNPMVLTQDVKYKAQEILTWNKQIYICGDKIRILFYFIFTSPWQNE